MTQRTRGALIFGAAIVAYVPLLLSSSLVRKLEGAEASLTIRTLFFGFPSELYAWIDKEAWIVRAILPVSLLVMFVYLTLPVLFRFRAAGEPLDVGFFVRRFRRRNALAETAKFFIAILLATGSLGAVAYVLGLAISFAAVHLFGLVLSVPEFVLGMGTLAVLSVGSVLVMELISSRRKRASLLLFSTQLTKTLGDPLRVVLSARDWKQFASWLSFWDESVLAGAIKGSTDEQIRSISGAMQHVQRGGVLPATVAMFMDTEPSKLSLAHCINDIERIRDHFANTQLVE